MKDPPHLEILEGEAKIYQTKRDQDAHHYVIDARSNLMLRENTLYFPGWTLYANDKKIPINYENSKEESFGRITFQLKEGLHQVSVKYEDTDLRKKSKYLSLLFVFLGIALFLLRKKSAFRI